MNLKSYTLSGSWTLIRENDFKGIELKAAIPSENTFNIVVPHIYSQDRWKLDYAYSGAVSRYHGYVWYYRSFGAVECLSEDCRYLIEFDRVSYRCEVYLNGKLIGSHMHSEERFSFDVTDALSYDGENLLAVRCFEPVSGCEAVDGITLDKIPNGFWAGSENHPYEFPIDSAGGILEDVRLVSVPVLRIDDVFVEPDSKTGKVRITVTAKNHSNKKQTVKLSIRFSDVKTGATLNTFEGDCCIDGDIGQTTISSYIPEYKLWELKNPTLYVAEISLGESKKAVRFGFKELYVKEGFFFLNGRRFILKCAHGTPSAETVIQMKAMGFNAFRSIQQVVPKEVLDLCDELGFMIIESPLTSWGMRFHENTQTMVEGSLFNMIKMHRNHVCIGAYYLFNELKRGEILHTGSDALKKLRTLAPHSLFILSSGRWDLEYDLGSVSNPHSDEWECLLGNEGDANDIEHTYPSRFHVVHNLGMGDLHPYVYVPLDSVAKKWFRTVGKNGKPVFISECGIGTQEHAHRTYFQYLRRGASKDRDIVKETRRVCDGMDEFISRYDMENVYPFVNALCRDADRQNGRQRQMLFDLIRSNPKISAFSLTSWGGGNEGTLEGEGVIKESVAYAMQEGWAPLRWALFTDNRVMYADSPFTVEAVLCNEDVLSPGAYKAEARIKGKNGIVWKKDFIALYPSNGYANMPPLAATVLKEELVLPEGEYTMYVRLTEGDLPYGGELKFSVVGKEPLCDLPQSITAFGLSQNTKNFLASRGIKVHEFCPEGNDDIIFVGIPEDRELTLKLFELIENGATAVFLNNGLFAREENKEYLRRIAGECADCSSTIDWLYHFDSVHIRHPIFYGIHDEGLLELDAFFELYPRLVITGEDKAKLTVCASIKADGGTCTTSLTVGEYGMGKGRAVINGFRVEEALEKNPYADRMLLNFILHYKK